MLKNFRKLKKGTQRIHIALVSISIVVQMFFLLYDEKKMVVVTFFYTCVYIILVLIYAWIKDGYRQDKENRLNKDNAQQN